MHSILSDLDGKCSGLSTPCILNATPYAAHTDIPRTSPTRRRPSEGIGRYTVASSPVSGVRARLLVRQFHEATVSDFSLGWMSFQLVLTVPTTDPPFLHMHSSQTSLATFSLRRRRESACPNGVLAASCDTKHPCASRSTSQEASSREHLAPEAGCRP